MRIQIICLIILILFCSGLVFPSTSCDATRSYSSLGKNADFDGFFISDDNLSYPNFPTAAQIQKFLNLPIQSQVDIFIKLFLIENTEPILKIPNLIIVVDKDGNITSRYDDSLFIFLGSADYIMSIEVELEPPKIIIAEKENNYFNLNAGILIGMISGLSCLLIGIVAGGLMF